jgi:hypothetical protein
MRDGPIAAGDAGNDSRAAKYRGNRTELRDKGLQVADMTTSAQGFGPQGPIHMASTASAPPLPPPQASLGGAEGSLPHYVPPRGGGVVPRWRGVGSGNRLRWAALVTAVAVVLVASGVFRSGSKAAEIQAPATAQATAQAQSGLKQPGTLSVSGQAPFVLHYPSDWTPLTAAQLARSANPPAAGLTAEGDRVLLLVRPERPLTQSVATLSAQLTSSLRSRYPDFKLLSIGTTRTLAGPAWVYTFEHTRHGLVQSEVVISTAKAAYEVDIALRGGANRAARQMGEIVHSFQT